MFDQFIPHRFKPPAARMIEQANEVIEEYQALGIQLTLRALFYQFVSRDLIANTQQKYKQFGEVIKHARLAGLVDWDAIEDETRQLREYATEESPKLATLRLAENYIEDLWANQSTYAEQWIEKDAALGTIRPVCGRWRLPHFACRGNVSLSALYGAGQRLTQQLNYGKRVVILHFGDHDPSGLDMTRDNQERLDMFARCPEIEVRRIGLNMDQIERYRPPPNFAKEKDSRLPAYIAKYNTRFSWEMDALDPRVVDSLIDFEVRDLIDFDLWEAELATETENRAKLLAAAQAMEV